MAQVMRMLNERRRGSVVFLWLEWLMPLDAVSTLAFAACSLRRFSKALSVVLCRMNQNDKHKRNQKTMVQNSLEVTYQKLESWPVTQSTKAGFNCRMLY